jgi:hypothetical protein
MNEPTSAKTQPFFLLSLLLVAVLMTVSNIQGAIDLLPLLRHGTFHYHNVENILVQQPPLLSPTASKKIFAIRQSNFVNGQFPPSLLNTHLLLPSVGDQILPEMPNVLKDIPSSNNTVITIISMGRLVEKYLLERCIRSIRVRGAFDGYIMVFTDQQGFHAYRHSMAWDPRTKIILGWKQDLLPMKNVTMRVPVTKDEGKKEPEMIHLQEPIVYAQKTMVFKRFKTHHAKYIAADPDFSSECIRYVLYVDVDIVITKSLSRFFQEYVDTVLREYDQWNQNYPPRSQPIDFGFFSLFVDRHLKSKMHTGIILSDLKFQNRCIDSWRKEMDEFYHKSDQTILLNVIGNFSSYRCKSFELPPQHFNFANKRILTERKLSTLPTFLHITEFRTRRIRDSEVLKSFLRFILNLKEREEMVAGVSWEQVISPTATRNFVQ